ncbi:hypothetical protein C0993_003351, partial [Termitomyces sp. T159_Od127]
TFIHLATAAGTLHLATALDIGDQQEDVEQEEEAEVGPEAAPPVQSWGWELPQWSWLPEWGASDSTTRDVSSGDEPKS